jgi:CRISPR system Cascade subunit CasD
MSTLLLRLTAPLQSWGVDSKFDRRGTQRAPTKSGVIGLIAAGLGRRRDESVEDLAALRFGVRIDQEGTLLRDYHTVKSSTTSYVTHRYYLSDAIFLVGLEGDEALLAKIEDALQRPAFPLFLGRRSCPPEGKISLGIRSGKSLLESLREEPWLLADRPRSRKAAQVRLRIIVDAGEKDAAFLQRDIPLSFSQVHRQFGFRRVYEPNALVIQHPGAHEKEKPTEHDPILELEE